LKTQFHCHYPNLSDNNKKPSHSLL